MKVSFKVLFLSVILMQVKVIYGEEKSSSSEEDDQITTTVQPEAIPEDNVQENKSAVSSNNNKTMSSTSLPALIGNIVTRLGKRRRFFFHFETVDGVLNYYFLWNSPM